MKEHEIDLSANARKNLEDLWDYVAEDSGETAADELIATILDDCDSLRFAPRRGALRKGFGSNLRIIGGAKGRVAIAFTFNEGTVTIVSIRYAGWRLKRKDLR